MRRIDVTFNGRELTFRSNDDGDYLFVGSENRQISSESGFHSLRRMKAAIRHHLRFQLGAGVETYPKISFRTDGVSNWKA